jgi:hypothetical protein
MFTDAYQLEVINDVAYIFNGSNVSKKKNEDFGLSCNVDEDAEEGATVDANQTGVEVSQARVIDVIDTHRLVETSFDKKSFLAYFKQYLATLLEKVIKPRFGEDTAAIDGWKKKVQDVVKEYVLDKFQDFEFYTGEQMNPEGMVLLMSYREDQTTPYFIAWKDGLQGIKY